MHAKEAVDALWKARGYLKLKPKQRHDKLGYQLDREAALGYLVTFLANLLDLVWVTRTTLALGLDDEFAAANHGVDLVAKAHG